MHQRNNEKTIIAASNLGYAISNYIFYQDSSMMRYINCDENIEVPQPEIDSFDKAHATDFLLNSVISQTILRSGLIASMIITHPKLVFDINGSISAKKAEQFAVNLNEELHDEQYNDEFNEMCDQLTYTAIYTMAFFNDLISKYTEELLDGTFHKESLIHDIDSSDPKMLSIFTSFFDTTRMLIEMGTSPIPLSIPENKAC